MTDQDLLGQLVMWLDTHSEDTHFEDTVEGIDLDLLAAYLAGTLQPGFHDQVEALLASRPDLREAVVALREAPGASFDARGDPRSGKNSRLGQRRIWIVTLAAAAVLALGMLLVPQFRGQPPRPEGPGDVLARLRLQNPALLSDLALLGPEALDRLARETERSGAAIQIYLPRDVELDNRPSFHWADPEDGPFGEFDLELSTDTGEPVFAGGGNGPSPLSFPPADPLLAGQTYLWTLSVGPDGEVIEGSGAFRMASDEERQRWGESVRVIQSATDGAAGQRLLIELALRRSYTREALRLARAAVEAHPSDARARRLLETILLRLGVPHARHVARTDPSTMPRALREE